MWIGAIYIISSFPWSLLIFSGCQQCFGDPSEGVSSQTRPCTDVVTRQPPQPHTQADAWYGRKKKPISRQKHALSFVRLKVERHCSDKVAATCQGLENNSESGFQILLSCMKLAHKYLTVFDNCNASEMRWAFSNAFQTLPSH